MAPQPKKLPILIQERREGSSSPAETGVALIMEEGAESFFLWKHQDEESVSYETVIVIIHLSLWVSLKYH